MTALGHPMSNTMLSRIERAQRRCDVDDLIAIAEALHVSASVLLRGGPVV
ncbi:toxin-antitoxin system, antitoxin component, Xre domain protein [Streptomyces ipomoeae 91-03]|uniref:Toxin-antitoxin system, antitoxin component, Xre domain protein n=1 Tax=Streptomyces ipomoeae 91-03 TaxID=698759 RepID=L1KXD3_9ACTN|nr:toxin-antitoxin system, antitoxin component, Xre domain protein [Streptomyces ipomoeae 91-03]